MRRSLTSALVLAAALSFSLVACVPDDGPGLATAIPTEPPETAAATPEPPSSPSPSEDPLLVEARDLHQRYMDKVGELLASGDPTPEAFEGLATPDQAAVVAADVESTLASGFRAEGRPTNKTFEIIDRADDSMVAAICIDNSDVVTWNDGVRRDPTQPLPRLVRYSLSPELLISEVGGAPDELGLEC